MKRRKDGRFVKVITYNGKRISFYSRAATPREAEKDIQKQLLNYSETKKKGKTFPEVADEWETQHFPTLEYNTSRRYKSLLNHCTEHFEGKYIKDITPLEIERFGAIFAAKQYTTKTIKDIMSVLRMVFKFAFVRGYISNVPTQFVTLPKGKQSTKRQPLTDKEMKIVINNVNTQFGFLPYFLMYTGLRLGEALALKFSDIDLQQRLITINKSIYYDGNNPCVKSPKTKSGIRNVILLDCVADKLPKGKPNDNLFSHDGKPYIRSWYEHTWKTYCEETGLNITAYQLRHTYATMLFEADIDIKDAQNLMGHSDISTTKNIYTHIRANRLKTTADKLNKLTTL